MVGHTKSPFDPLKAHDWEHAQNIRDVVGSLDNEFRRKKTPRRIVQPWLRGLACSCLRKDGLRLVCWRHLSSVSFVWFTFTLKKIDLTETEK